MLIKPSGGRASPIPHNSVFVNTLSVISPEGFNAQNKEFVKRFIEKNLEPEAQNALAVNRFLKKYQDFFREDESRWHTVRSNSIPATLLFPMN